MIDIPVAFVTYQRAERAEEVVRLLAAEATTVIVVNNSERKLVNLPSNAALFDMSINTGYRGQLLAALHAPGDLVICWDDDAIPKPGWSIAYERIRHLAEAGAIVGYHCRRFFKGTNFPNLNARLIRTKRRIYHVDSVGQCCCLTHKKYLLDPRIWAEPWPKMDYCMSHYARTQYDADLLCDYRIRDIFDSYRSGIPSAAFRVHRFRPGQMAEIYGPEEDWEFGIDRHNRKGDPPSPPKTSPE